MSLIVIEAHGGPEHATIVTTEAGDNKVFENISEATAEAQDCQDGIVVDLSGNAILTQHEKSEYLETFFMLNDLFYDNKDEPEISKALSDKSMLWQCEITQEWTDEFQSLHANTIWGQDLDWMETLETFFALKLKTL